MSSTELRNGSSLELRLGAAMLITACSLVFFSVYFLQFAIIGTDCLITLEVSLSTLASFAVMAFLSFRMSFRTPAIACAIVILLLVRHLFLPGLVGTQTIVSNTLVGIILALSVVLIGSVLPSLGSRRSCLILGVGFICAPLIQLLYGLAGLPDAGYVQELALALSALLVMAYALLRHVSPAAALDSDRTPQGRFRNILLALGVDQKTDALLVTIVMLFFCFGTFEPFLSSHPQAFNSYAPLMLACISLLAAGMLFVVMRCPGEKQLRWSGNYVLICLAIMVVLAFTAITSGEITPALCSLSFVIMVALHLMIWLRCCHALDSKINAITLVCLAFGCVMVFHRLGWCVNAAAAQAGANVPVICGAVSLVAAVIGLVALCLRSESIFGESRDYWLASPSSAEADRESDDVPTESDQLDPFATKASALFERCALTERQREIALMYGKGRSIANIAQTLVLSENTVKTHIRNIYQKCGVANRQELIDKIESS